MVQLASNELRSGIVFNHEGHTYIVLKYEHGRHGKHGSTNTVKVKDIDTGAVLEKSFRGNDSVDEANISRRTVQYLYSDVNKSYFLDSESFEQIELKRDEAVISYIKEGEKVIILFKDETPLSAELPNTVILSVTYTEPGFKGNTATNTLKPATVETGLEVRVPIFINIDDKVKINTETGDYLSRV